MATMTTGLVLATSDFRAYRPPSISSLLSPELVNSALTMLKRLPFNRKKSSPEDVEACTPIEDKDMHFANDRREDWE